MDNLQFYSTPPALAAKMLQSLTTKYGDLIIDPSAGSGALLDEAAKRVGKGNCYAIEIDPTRQATLMGKGYTVIDTDFLSHTGHRRFEACVMNPPFNAGAKHFLHALRHIEARQFVCLLNTETIENPYTKERELLLKMIEDMDGTIERAGQAFLDAERKTAVDVSIVRVNKVIAESVFELPKHLHYSPVQHGDEDGFETKLKGTELARQGTQLQQLVDDYQRLIHYYRLNRQTAKALADAAKRIDTSEDEYLYRELCDSRIGASTDKDWERILAGARKAAWRTMFRMLGLDDRMSKASLKGFLGQTETLNKLEFNRVNAFIIIDLVMGKQEDMQKESVLDSFKVMTEYHKDNRVNIEGWHTNSQYIVGRKFILPIYWSYGYIDRKDMDKIDDIEKGMCAANGMHFSNLNASYDTKAINLATGMYDTKDKDGNVISSVPARLSALINAAKQHGRYGEKFESRFFWFKLFKKGSMHFEFKDQNEWARFIQMACADSMMIGAFDKRDAWRKAWGAKKQK